ncbi:MAG: hypothetical protein ACJAVK_002239 [Akkermansiaceae bacterium]
MCLKFFLISLCLSQISLASTPAPSSTIFGKVRGEFGFGLTGGSTSLLLLADGEEVARTPVSESGVFGENYRLTLPVDLNPAKGAYRTAARDPGADVTYSFVAERNGTCLLISKVESVSADPAPESGAVKQINFILGADSDGDGLPDDWERFQAGLLGPIEGDPLDVFSAKGDRDRDGLSDYGEYVAGTFALLFQDGLNFAIDKVYESGRTELSFLAIDSKSYRIESSRDLKTWVPVEFSLSDDPVNTFYTYKSEEIENITVLAEPAVTTGKVVYRLHVD